MSFKQVTQSPTSLEKPIILERVEGKRRTTKAKWMDSIEILIDTIRTSEVPGWGQISLVKICYDSKSPHQLMHIIN